MDDKKLTREQAESIADELLAYEPRYRDSQLAKLAKLAQQSVRMWKMWRMRTVIGDERPSPFVSPASPAWGVIHRETDTTKQGH